MGTLRRTTVGDTTFALIMDRRISATDTRILNILRRHVNPGSLDMITLTNEEYQLGAKTKPKSADLKAGLEQVKEWVDTYGYNVVGVMGADAFEKVMGYKGISKAINRPLWSDVINCKVIPLIHPSQLLYQDPVLTETYRLGFELLVRESAFPEVKAEEAAPTSYTIIDTIGKFRKFIDYYRSENVTAFAYDLETTGFNFIRDQILTIQFSHAPCKSYLIPTNFYKLWSDSEWAEITAGIRMLFADDRKTLIGHNIKFDNRFIEHHWGVPVRKHNVFDTMIAKFLCDETTPNGLKELSCQHTDLGAYDDDLDEFRKKYCKQHKLKERDFTFAMIPFEILALYALKDADCTMRLYHLFKKKLVEEQQEEVFAMVMRFQYLLSRMEITGSPVDVEYAQQYLVEVDAQLVEMSSELMAFDFIVEAERLINKFGQKKHEAESRAGKYKHRPFNLNSTDMKRVLFYDVMRLPIFYVSKVKSSLKDMTPKRKENISKKFAEEAGVKWNEEVKKLRNIISKSMDAVVVNDANKKLKEMSEYWLRRKASVDKRSIAAWEGYSKDEKILDFLTRLRRYNELTKIRNTYIAAIIEKQVDGWIHPSFNVIGAKSGRLSCRDPNYQQIPAHSDEAKKVKRITKAPEGWVLVGADLSAAEMRWVTIASGDEKMTEVFNSGKDSHGAIAKDIFNLECDANDVKHLHKMERQCAKACQFLSIYGGQASALAATAGITEERAQKILDGYFETYTGIKKYLADTEDFVALRGYSQSLLGRRNRHAITSIAESIAKKKLIESRIEAHRAIITERKLDYKESASIRAEIDKLKTESEALVGQDIFQHYNKEVRVAINATIQSVSSDGMLLSACALQDEIEERQLHDRIKIINLIHDAIYCLVRQESLQEMHDLIIKHLTTLPPRLIDPESGEQIIPPIRMEADAEWGYTWDSFSDDFGEEAVVEEDEEDIEEEEE